MNAFMSFWQRFYRHPEQKIIAGVCAGMAQALGWQARSVRGLWVVTLVFLGWQENLTGLDAVSLVPLAYIALWLVVEARAVPAPLLQPVQGSAAERLKALDNRLAQMEAVATSEEFRLRQEIESLR
jgi:phage shock protein PspC (stress-responsive transcriptional regulator)